MFKLGIRSGLELLRSPAWTQRLVQTRSMRLYQERTVRAMYWRARSFDAIKLPPEDRRDTFQEWNYRSEIFAFSRRLQENMSEDTLRQIFAHPSYILDLKNKQTALSMPESNLSSNVKLVQRGRELLDLCTKPYLRYTFSLLPEEGIEAIHNYLASEPVMADIAKWIGCKDLILTTEWPPSPATMADTVFAVLAGIESDLGLERARRFTIDIILSYLAEKDILDDVWIIKDPEKMLSTILKNSQLPTYEPRIIFQTGIKTLEPCHIVGIYVQTRLFGSSAGETLQIAENCAVLQSLRRIFDVTENREPMLFGDKLDKIDFTSYEKKQERVDSLRFDIASLR